MEIKIGNLYFSQHEQQTQRSNHFFFQYFFNNAKILSSQITKVILSPLMATDLHLRVEKIALEDVLTHIRPSGTWKAVAVCDSNSREIAASVQKGRKIFLK